MIKVNWKQDYCKYFSCFKCQQAKLHLAGVNRHGKQRFRCPKCKFKIQLAINLNRRSQFLESRLIDGQIDWGKDYKGEFACPKCQSLGMIVRGKDKRLFLMLLKRRYLI